MAEPNTQSLPALAIVGLSLKFPQDAVSSESFWDMIVEGRCASTDFPPDRLNIDAYYHPDPNRLDSLSVRGGHFMKEDISLFDAPFFSITAAEAKAMDPQQRLVLEMSYRALENAGITMDQVARSKTCVFTGSFSHDYETLLTKDLQKVAKWAATGTSMNMQSNRVSWFFNLVGPSATVDTACSSSLMAIDLACQSIWSGDSTMGMAIGSNAILALETVLSLDNLGLLSPDSRCYSFDRRGNGYARGEGIGALIIRPLDDAIRNGDTIRAVIRSSSSNQDGRTPGITMPSMEMQERLVRDTYRKGGLDMAPTRYFEAHGTGTSVGDPIESKGIGSLFRHYRSPEDPLYIGSVKSNIGHLEGASGIAGVIKTVLALENGIIPPNSTNFESLNPRIDDEFLHIKIPNKPVPWPTEGLRRASVSSFGFGGSNSHIVLDDAYNFLRIRRLQGSHDTLSRPPSLESNKLQIPCDAGPIPKKQATDSAKLLVWSSADEKGISRIQESWRSFMATVSPSDQDKPQYFNNLAHTLGTRRTHLPWRTFVVAHASDDWGGLPDKFAPVYRSLSSPNMALVFSGQGAQWYAMGRELLQAYPVFLQSIEAAGVYLWTVGCQWSLLDELQRTEAESRVNQPEYSQTMCTALQVALVDLLQYWNLTPKFVVGHSSGEIAAAYCTGAISRESAWKIAFYRGKLSGRLETLSPRKGTMLAVALSREDVIPYIEGLTAQLQHARINIACVNSPKSVTVSGDEILIDALRTRLDQDEVFARKLKVGVAYHSTQMQEIASDYRKALRGLEKPAVRQGIRPEMVSSVTGTWIESHELLQADYWVRNMVSPVLFSDALSTMCSSRSTDPPKKLDQSHRRQLPIHHLVEAGPHSVLQGPCKDILKALNKAQSVTYLSLLVRNAPAVGTVLAVVGALYSTGYPVNLSLVNIDPAREPKALSNLPEYPFDHSKSYWNESQVSKGQRLRRFGRVDLLGVPDANWNPLEGHWRHIIRTTEMPWVQDHKINDTILYPGMGMVVMAIEAAKQMAEPDKCIAGFNVKEIIFHAPIRIESNAEDVETGFYMRPVQNVKSKSPGWFEFRLCSNENQTWTENCTGSIQIVYTSEDPKAEKDAQVAQQLLDDQVGRYSVVQQAATSPMDSDLLYDIKARCGFRYGKAFNLINTLSFHRDDDNQVISQVRKFSEGSETIHPTTLDAIVQTTIWTLTKGGTQLFPTMVPTQIEKLWVSHDGISRLSSDILRTHATLSEDPQRGLSIDANAFDDELQQAMVEISGLRMNIVSASNSDDDILEGSQEPWCHHLEWKPDLELLSNPEVINFCTGKCEDPAGIEIFFTEVDFLLTATVLGTLRQLPKQGLDPAQPHLKKYVDWMLERKRLFDEGKVQFAFEPWKSRLNDPVFIQEVEDRVLKENKRGYLMASVARNLPLFLTGELNPLEFLFEGDQMKDFYFEGLHDSNGVKQLDTYLDLLAHQNPQMRILEVGAGTGSMTDIMLRYLGRADDSSNERRYGEWHYTDISRSFFGQAQDEFHQEGERIRFQPLDIEKDPETQGFECGTYDVVVASLVFHATSDLKRTLMNARKLLKPRGKLILNEFTATDVIRTAFVLGLLEGWWLSSEPYRKFGPCVDKSRWNELMQQAGFSGLDVALSDYDDIRSHEQSVLVSSAVEDYPAASQLPDIEIVYEPTEVGQAELAQSLAVLCRDLRVPVVRCTSVDGAGESISDNHLLRVFLVEWQKPVLDDIQPGLFQKLQRLLCSTADVLWINSGGGVLSPKPHFRLVDGLFRVLVAEDDRKKCYLLSLEDQETNKSHRQGQIMKVIQLLLSSAADGLDTEYVEQHGMLHIGRLIAPAQLNEAVSSRTTPKQHKLQIFGGGIPFQLDSVSSGLLQGFQFIEDESAGQALEPNEIEIEVKCAGINFRDVLIAVGQLKSPHTGFECSGVVVRTGAACKRFQVGDAVAALHAGCYSSVIRVRETGGVVKIGRGISFADAAAIPVNFATAYIALHDVARMRAGESILIHSGSGGTGQAAIQLAQNLGATVFTTVGSEAKKQFLMDVYNIPESHIFSSRTTLFAKAIKLRTGNRGVDVIFNSLAGESLQASWQCIAPYGRFLEIGIKDILANDRLPMLQFLDNVSFSAINLATMMHDRPEMCAAALASVYTLLEQRKVRPAQHVQVYGIAEMETAFRSMQSGKHIGKMVIEMRKDDQVMTVLNTKPSTSLDPDATYVISGGLGGLGRNIAHWLADRGARNLLLLSRSGLQSPKAQELVKQLQARDVRIMIPSCDVSNLESLQKVLDGCRQQMPPIKGCIQAAMVLRDALYETMSHQSWHEALAPKVQGSWNLHNQLPSGMDFFVMLSSIAGIFGMKGQANYAAGNTFQDALARYRVGLGEKATSVDLGVIGFTGAVVDNARLQERILSNSVMTPITEPEIHALLDLYCDPQATPYTALTCQTTVHISPNLDKMGSGDATWLNKPMFRHLCLQNGLGSSNTAQATNTNVAALLNQAQSLVEANEAIIHGLTARLSKALSIPVTEIDTDKPLHQYGVDSLVAVELRSWFAKDLQADIAVFDILGSATVRSVGQLATGKSKMTKEKTWS